MSPERSSLDQPLKSEMVVRLKGLSLPVARKLGWWLTPLPNHKAAIRTLIADRVGVQLGCRVWRNLPSVSHR